MSSPGFPKELVAHWSVAYKAIGDASAANTKAPAGGINWCLNVPKAAHALFKAVEWSAKMAKAVATVNPVEIVLEAVKGLDVVVGLLGAVREQMKPMAYCAYVALSDSPPTGVTRNELLERFNKFIADFIDSRWPLPWIGYSKDELEKHRKEMNDYPKQFDSLIDKLIDQEYAVRKEDRILYKDRSIIFTPSE